MLFTAKPNMIQNKYDVSRETFVGLDTNLNCIKYTFHSVGEET